MTRTRSTDAPAKSRRRFLKLAALGSVAVVASALPRQAGAASKKKKKRAKKAKPAPPAAAPAPNPVEAEVAKQKASVAELLKTIRGYELPPGSEPGFVFVPSSVPKRGKSKHDAVKQGGAG